MISSTCIWLICLVYAIFNLYSIISSCILVNSACVWPKQHAFDPFLLYLIYLACIWPLHQVVDWSKMYLIYSACIWLIWSGYDQLIRFLFDCTCKWSMQPVYGLLCLLLFHSSCIWLIQPAQDLVILFLFDLTYFFYSIQPAFNWFWMYSISSTCIMILSIQPVIMIPQSCIYLLDYWFNMYFIDSTCACPNQSAFDAFIQYLTYSACICYYMIYSAWFSMHMVDSTCIWSIQPIYDIVDFFCLVKPVLDECNLDSNNTWSLQPLLKVFSSIFM